MKVWYSLLLHRDVDEVLVQRRMEGVKLPLNRAERFEVVRRLHARGLTDKEIGRLTGIHDSQVWRDRQKLGLAAIPVLDRPHNHNGKWA